MFISLAIIQANVNAHYTAKMVTFLHQDTEIQRFKALAKRTRKSMQVLDLRPTCVSFGHPLAATYTDLRRLALTLVELKFGLK